MIKVLATDLDGTLFYPKKPVAMVAKKNRKLVRDFIDQGGRVVLVSSRGEQFLERLKAKLELPLDYIGCDGTVISVSGQRVMDKVFDVEKTKQLIAEIRDSYDPGLILIASRTQPTVMTRTRVSRFTNFLYFAYEAVQGAYREPYVRSDHLFYNEINKGEVHKIMVLVGITKAKQAFAEKMTKELSAKYTDFEFAWLNQFIEITPKGCSKASGVAFYLDYLGLGHDNVVVVGDSGNDVPMFEAFHENSYCMSHAKGSVKEKAAHVVSHVYDLRPVLCPSVDSNPSEKEG
ncbi:MAG: Cof-type HAD-IIB family hydrolase [Bacilli bacterium]|nr:Cof-type HAD-IIB family hydrolase [Bacilli bacterium]